MSEQPQPSEKDIANAAYRAKIAREQKAAYVAVLRLALGLMGPGWYPRRRHYLVEHDEEERARREGGKPQAAATVFTVSNGVRQRHFALVDGKPKEFPTWEEGFGDMLHERHPTRGIMHKGEFCRTGRYSLCWAGFDAEYTPATAEELAAKRAVRAKNKAEKADRKFAKDHPLAEWAERQEGARWISR